MKKRCAQKALAYIQDGMVIGLGGGSTIAHLARFVKESGKQVQIVTPSLENGNALYKAGTAASSAAPDIPCGYRL